MISSACLATKLIRATQHCRFCTINAIKVAPDSYIKINSSVPDLVINVTSQWRDTVDWDNSDDVEVSFEHDHGDIFFSISAHKPLDCAENKRKFNIRTPEMINLDVSSTNTFELVTKNKLQGDLCISSKEKCSLSLNKVRGESIELAVPQGIVTVTKSLEAQQASIDCQSFSIKMANVNKLSLQAEKGGKFNALYTQITRALVRHGDLEVDLVRGHLQAKAVNGNLTAQQIDGGLELHSMNGQVTAQVNSLLSPRSEVQARGQVMVTLNPEIRGYMECAAPVGRIHVDLSTFISHQEPPSTTSTSDRTKALTGELGALIIPSPPNWVKKSAQSGKIDLLGAEYAALQKAKMHHADSGAKATGNGIKRENNGVKLMVKSQAGDVALKGSSWMDVIKKKHGVM
eukprot:gene26581-32124_t